MLMDKLWKNYQNNNDLDTKNKLIEEYAPIIKIVASRLYNYYGGKVEFDDLMGFGALGLIDAIEKFDPMKGSKFESYAQLRIRGAIIDGFRKLDWIPRSLRTKSKLIERTMYELENKLNREVSPIEIAKELNISVKDVEVTLKELNMFNIHSLDEIIINNGELPLEYDNDPQQILESSDYMNSLSGYIASLPEKEKLIITLYYYEELNYKEIGNILELSESRISQIHSKAIKIIRNQLRKHN